MGDAPTVTTEDVAHGKEAFGTPSPTGRKRRRKTGPAGRGSPIMVGARARYGIPTRRQGDSKKIVCKAHQKLNGRIGGRWAREAGASSI